MRPLFTHEPLIWLLVVASLVFWQVFELVLYGRPSSQGRNSPEWSFFAVMALMFGGLAAGILASANHLAPIGGPPWWPVIVGLALIWSGLAFRAWSIHTLGRFFKVMVVIQDDHKVVDWGPYRLLRHPSYLGGIVALTGIGFTEGDWVSVAVMFLCTLLAFLIRIPVEERALLGVLGDDYAAYMQRTARLLPGVY